MSRQYHRWFFGIKVAFSIFGIGIILDIINEVFSSPQLASVCVLCWFLAFCILFWNFLCVAFDNGIIHGAHYC